MVFSAVSDKQENFSDTSGDPMGDASVVSAFYDSISRIGYLTPLQRKKQREKRKIELSPSIPGQESAKKVKLIKPRDKKLVKKPKEKKLKSIKKVEKIEAKYRPLMITVSSKAATPPQSNNKFFSHGSLGMRASFTLSFEIRKKSLSKKDSENFGRKDALNESNEGKCSSKGKKVRRPKSSPIQNSDDTHDRSNVLMSLENMTSNEDIQSSVKEQEVQEKSKTEIQKRDELYKLFNFDWPSEEVVDKQDSDKTVSSDLSENVLGKTQDSDENTNRPKLFPIFEGKTVEKVEPGTKKNAAKVPKKKMWLSKGSDQLIIDAGQKEIGAKVCPTCNMVYSIGEVEDEKLHLKYHNAYLSNLKFSGWNKERVIGSFYDGRLIMVKEDDKSFMLRKVKEVLEVANRDLGFPGLDFPARLNATFLLFVTTDKRIVGCLVAESISSASKIVADGIEKSLQNGSEKDSEPRAINWCCSDENLPAICGINRIWVASNYRRKKVATRMVDCLRLHFVYGYTLGLDDVAFSDPSVNGRDFAAAYTGTNNFLVYK